ncbi:FAD binding domain-containing protein [Armillaria fumosa]|nr:FAD binding domain-containing protein [Armillaria fumosa]
MAILPDQPQAYAQPLVSSHANASLPNDLGVNDIPTYPDLLNGTNCESPAVPDFKPPSKVDVLVVGAGPVGLMTAALLARQGITTRILDKSAHPLPVGRADALQPRTLELFQQIGLIDEVTPLGPLMGHTVVYKDGKKEIFAESHQSPSESCRYHGLHTATQTEIEHALIRDLIRHDMLVERPCTATSYKFDEDADASVTHPITVNVTNHATGAQEPVTARYLVGSDGAHSMIRKSLPIKFDGIKTDLHWGIVDAVFETNFPHRWIFGTVLNTEHGGVLIIPRERDMVRLYAQLKPEPGQPFDASKWGPNEVLDQINKIFAPYYVKYASPVDWFTILTINERVASSFTYKDRIFLAGDSCHVHSAKGAFGLNTGVLDAQNLAWKLGALCKGIAKPALLSSYDVERRENALRAVKTSARYLRFVGNCTFESLDGLQSPMNIEETKVVPSPGEDEHVAFFRQFAAENTGFLIGLDIRYGTNALNKPVESAITGIRCGYRAPDPRVSLSRAVSGRLYDAFGRIDQFKLVVFASNLAGEIKARLQTLDSYLASSRSFYQKYADVDLFKVVVVVRSTPSQAEARIRDYPFLAKNAQVVFDDQLPPGIFGADAHSIYGVDHKLGGVVVVRPDTFVGTAVVLDNVSNLDSYFTQFLSR